jgi:hypothetical protein
MAVSPSTLSSLVSFPGQGSIPPACFYNMQGLAGWLNNHPEYKLPFSYTGEFGVYLIPPEFVTSTLSSSGYKQENVPLAPVVTLLSQGQGSTYMRQINLFYKVYSINSNAYINYAATGRGPVYYTFSTFTEKYEYNSAVQLVNKMYNFQAMAAAPTLNWQVPFPINM